MRFRVPGAGTRFLVAGMVRATGVLVASGVRGQLRPCDAVHKVGTFSSG